MANPTTNFGWVMPTSTDLVTDLPADFAVFGQGVDTTLADLKGGTTGQVLSKASNTDMDFTWTADAGIPATILDAKGDLIAATAADTASRLAVGTNGQVLTADSTAATGLKWASATQTDSFTLINSGGTALTGASTITISGFSGYNTLYVFLYGSSANASANVNLQLNGDTAAKYSYFGFQIAGNTQGYISSDGLDVGTAFQGARMGNAATNNVASTFTILGANSTSPKMLFHSGGGNGTSPTGNIEGGTYSGTSAVTSVSIVSSTGNFDAGTVWVYGA